MRDERGEEEAEDDDEQAAEQVDADRRQEREASARSSSRKIVTVIGRSSSVRSLAGDGLPTRLALRSAKPARKALTIVGSERAAR